MRSAGRPRRVQYCVLIPLVSCVVSATLASGILARGHADSRNRLAALVLGAPRSGPLRVLWNSATEADGVLW
jgi:hypothetical protein